MRVDIEVYLFGGKITANVFIQRLQTFSYFCHVFTFLTFFYLRVVIYDNSQCSADTHYRQTAGWIKMPIVMEVGFWLGHTVLDGDPAPP